MPDDKLKGDRLQEARAWFPNTYEAQDVFEIVIAAIKARLH